MQETDQAETRRCRACHGSREVDGAPCPTCKGEGVLRTKTTGWHARRRYEPDPWEVRKAGPRYRTPRDLLAAVLKATEGDTNAMLFECPDLVLAGVVCREPVAVFVVEACQVKRLSRRTDLWRWHEAGAKCYALVLDEDSGRTYLVPWGLLRTDGVTIGSPEVQECRCRAKFWEGER